MVNEYGIIILITFVAVLSSVIFMRIQKETKGILVMKTIIFFYSAYYFVISAMKWILGSPENTLLQSFWDMEMATYVHYGLPLLGISIVAPFLFHFIFKGKCSKIIVHFCTAIISLFLLVWPMEGQVGNAVYCVCYLCALFLALLFVFTWKKDFSYIEKKEWKARVFEVLPCVSLYTFMISVFYPNELFLTNMEEFFNPFWSFLFILLVAWVLMTAFLIGLILLLPKKCVPYVATAFFALSICSYLQALFLNRDLNALTGDEQQWETSKLVINTLIWLAIFLVLFFLVCWRKAIYKIFCKISIYLGLVLAVTLITLIVTTDVSANTKRDVFTNKNAISVSANDNVLIFILDLFDSTVMQDIMQNNPEFTEPLHDFVFYRNTTSAHGHTKLAIPYLLTGTKWQDDEDREYKEYAYDNPVFFDALIENGYELGIYTDSSYIAKSQYDKVVNYESDVKRKNNIKATVATMVRTSCYKIMPLVLKNNYSYYSSDISEMVKQENVWSIDDDLYFYRLLTSEGLRVDESIDNVFRFYHMRGAHTPFYLSEDLKADKTYRESSIYQQAKGSMKIVYEYLEQLKKLGKYDDATIIITADHGNVVFYDENSNRPNETSMPIMFVKMPKEHREQMEVSNAPVSHAEIIPTVFDVIGKEGDYWQRFSDIGESQERERFFIDAVDGRYTMKCKITGDAQILDNWDVIDIRMCN